MTLTLAQARTIIDAAFAAARADSLKPLGALVLDAGGHLIAFQREDGASWFRFDIARAKAYGALGMAMDTREIAARAASSPSFYASLTAITQGGVAFAPGGVIIRDAAGAALGAIGISGDTGDADEASAKAGIRAAGLSYADA